MTSLQSKPHYKNYARLAAKSRSVMVSIARFILLLAFSYVLLNPIFIMISDSLKTSADLIDPTVVWVTKRLNLSSFGEAFKTMDYLNSLKNTVVFELAGALMEVASCAVIAYGMSRFEFGLKKVLMVFLILTILVPDGMLLLSRVVHYRHLDILGILGGIYRLTGLDLRPNLIDSPFAFYLPAIFGVGLKGGLFIFIYMQFFKGLPKELEDAAWIDGAGPIKAFVRIIIPSSGVVILTVSLLSVVFHWNDYWYALMYTDSNRPLAYVVRNISQYIFLEFGNLQSNDARYVGVTMASCLLFIAPPTIMYLFLQRKFIQSIDRVGIVG